MVASFFKIENYADMYLSAPCDYVEAIGGKLELKMKLLGRRAGSRRRLA